MQRIRKKREWGKKHTQNERHKQRLTEIEKQRKHGTETIKLN
jgi:hypothetical protein